MLLHFFKLSLFIAESFTADHKPLLGPDVTLRGYYHACGFNSAGIMLSGGCGNELAKWIIHGHPDLDMFGYDIRYVFYNGMKPSWFVAKP